MRRKLFVYFLLPVLILVSACDLEQEIEVLLPEHKPQLVVECYLEEGKPYRLTLTESSSYFDPPQLPLVPDAEVYITHNGERIKLDFNPDLNKETNKFYTHVSSEIMRSKPGDIFGLEIKDGKGRNLKGFTTILPTVEIEAVEWKFNDKDKAYLLTSFQDNPNMNNYYRYVTHLDSLNTNAERDFTADDDLTNGKRISYGSAYSYERNDTVIVSLYHIEKQYYDYLNSVSDARNANGNPFGQPAKIKSSVQGGIGIFTNLAYQRKTVIIQ